MLMLQALRRALTQVAVVAVLMLLPAGLLPGGTWFWPQALWLIAVLAMISIAANVALAVWRPASFEVRKGGPVAAKENKQPWIDAVSQVGYLVFLAAWVALIPVDVFVLHIFPSPPPAVAAVGLVMAAVGPTISHLAVWQNQYASPTIQEQAGQKVVDTGIYGLIRHPLYAGNLLMFAGVALWLGSLAALLATTVHLAATLWRIGIEEGYLRENLPSYADYARRVRARLIPFVI
jgi:protein-S-isoprenylcysteine O-methyltransferase Ste14